jgi:hypothetical protein
MNRHAQLARAREKKSELDDAVICNLPPDLLPLWSRIRTQFKGSAQARLDAFLHYAEEHGSEIEQAIEAEAEAKLAADLDSFAFGANAAPTRPKRARAPKPRARPSVVVDDVINLDDVPIVVWGDVVYIAA